jgi:hypothetical protein
VDVHLDNFHHDRTLFYLTGMMLRIQGNYPRRKPISG